MSKRAVLQVTRRQCSSAVLILPIRMCQIWFVGWDPIEHPHKHHMTMTSSCGLLLLCWINQFGSLYSLREGKAKGVEKKNETEHLLCQAYGLVRGHLTLAWDTHSSISLCSPPATVLAQEGTLVSWGRCCDGDDQELRLSLGPALLPEWWAGPIHCSRHSEGVSWCKCRLQA